MAEKKNRQIEPTAPRRIVVALRMAGIAGQDKLNGIFDYLSTGHRWQLIIYRTRQEFTAEVVAHEISRGAHGFIVGIPGTDEALNALACLDIPTVVMNVTGGNIEKRRNNIAFVKSDSALVGREAANTLLRQGIYKSYGYVGYRIDEGWSLERGRAFCEKIEEAGFPSHLFDRAHFQDRIEDKRTVVSWLKALPKPCGIFAACDDRAFEILDICRESGFKVPAEIGVIGVNNDPILCENSEPRLSSIQPNFIEEGRLASEMLDYMVSGKTIRTGENRRKIGIRSIVHRASTVAQSEAGKLVQRVLAYIDREAVKGIGVDDVARRFKISRSLLELRFRELQNESVYEAMLRIRLEEVRRRLRQTKEPIAEITAACGWKCPTPPKVLFKKRYGISMRAYRTESALTCNHQM